ncbi:MAG: hypothetical protein ACRDD1_13230 [Planctomycetia bacterium]
MVTKTEAGRPVLVAEEQIDFSAAAPPTADDPPPHSQRSRLV